MSPVDTLLHSHAAVFLAWSLGLLLVCLQVLIVFIIVTLYWGVGDDLGPGNVTNVSAILFM